MLCVLTSSIYLTYNPTDTDKIFEISVARYRKKSVVLTFSSCTEILLLKSCHMVDVLCGVVIT